MTDEKQDRQSATYGRDDETLPPQPETFPSQQSTLPPLAGEEVEEIGGPAGPDPTRYGDWERKGRCIDF